MAAHRTFRLRKCRGYGTKKSNTGSPERETALRAASLPGAPQMKFTLMPKPGSWRSAHRVDEVARYELKRDGLGSEFLAAVRDAERLINQNPDAWQATEYGRNVRRFVMGKFPFTLVYTELADEILIIALAHTSRQPGYWRTRL